MQSEFLWIRTVNGSDSQSLGLDDEELDLTSLLIALASEVASGSLFIKEGGFSFAGLTCTGLGCVEGAEGCAEGAAGMGVDEGDVYWISGVEQLEELEENELLLMACSLSFMWCMQLAENCVGVGGISNILLRGISWSTAPLNWISEFRGG